MGGGYSAEKRKEGPGNRVSPTGPPLQDPANAVPQLRCEFCVSTATAVY